MKQKPNNQEILLITGNRFASRLFCKKDTDNSEQGNHCPAEELEKACWEGMLNELLPELTGYPSHGLNNFIWSIIPCTHFLCVSIGRCPMPEKNERSIDPYFFLSSAFYN